MVFVFADQWRAQATGYAGDKNVRTPNLDRLAARERQLRERRVLLPGLQPVSRQPADGPVSADPRRVPERRAAAEARPFPSRRCTSSAGYETAYIGKWHLDGNQRSAFIPRERRQGFEFWKVLGCTHAYNNSFYYGDEDVKLRVGRLRCDCPDA